MFYGLSRITAYTEFLGLRFQNNVRGLNVSKRNITSLLFLKKLQCTERPNFNPLLLISQ